MPGHVPPPWFGHGGFHEWIAKLGPPESYIQEDLERLMTLRKMEKTFAGQTLTGTVSTEPMQRRKRETSFLAPLGGFKKELAKKQYRPMSTLGHAGPSWRNEAGTWVVQPSWVSGEEGEAPLHEQLVARSTPGQPFVPFYYRLQRRKPHPRPPGLMSYRSMAGSRSSSRRSSVSQGWSASQMVTPRQDVEEILGPEASKPIIPSGRRRSLSQMAGIDGLEKLQLEHASTDKFRQNAAKYGYAGRARGF